MLWYAHDRVMKSSGTQPETNLGRTQELGAEKPGAQQAQPYYYLGTLKLDHRLQRGTKSRQQPKSYRDWWVWKMIART